MNGHELLAIVLGGIVALGMAGGVVTTAAAASASDAPSEVDDGLVAAQDDDEDETETETEEGDEENETAEGDEQQNETVPITDAMDAAAEETNGTAVGAQLGSGDDGILGGDGDEQVYSVDVLLDDGTHMEVEVNATNGSVTQSQEADDGFLEGIFGEDNVPEDPINLSAIYNASEAVELAQNETEDNGTVTQVTLDTRDDDNLVYEVQIAGDDDQETTVVVDAMQDGEGVIEVDGEEVEGGDETGTETETETGEDEGDGMGDEGDGMGDEGDGEGN